MTALYIASAFAAGLVAGRYWASRAGRERDALKREIARFKRAVVLQERSRARERRLRSVI